MKFQQLTIHNIASIEDATINFEAQPLVDSEVFLITGKTGAGKSTILDAICLALYANTPRLEYTKMQGDTTDGDKTIKVGDTRQLMRRNTGEAFAQLTFIGNNGIHYEATWSVARARNKVQGNIQPKQWQLKNIDTDNTLTKDKEIEAEIHDAIGLDFNQFCRTTMLAQGEFTRFLNSKDDEKAEILEKITGVDIYSKIGARIFAITSQKEQDWHTAQQLIEGTHTLTEEDIARHKEELQGLEMACQSVKKAMDIAIQKRDWLKTNQELQREMAQAKTLLEQATAAVRSEEFLRNECLIKTWNETIEARGWLSDIQKANALIETQKKKLTEIEKQYAPLMGRTEESLTRQNVHTILETQQQNIHTKAEKLSQREQQVIALQLGEQRTHRDQLREHLATVQTAIERLENLHQEELRHETTRLQLEKDIAAIESKKQLSRSKDDSIRQAQEEMEKRKNEWEKQRDTIHKFAQEIRQRLQIGDECPVCRRKIEAALPQEDELNHMVQNFQDAFKQAEQLHKQRMEEKNQLEAEIKAALSTYNHTLQVYQTDQSVARALTRVQESANKLGLNQIDNNSMPQLLQWSQSDLQQIEQLNLRISEGEKMETATRNDRITLDRERQTFDLLVQRIHELDNQIATIQGQISNAIELNKSIEPQLKTFMEAHPEMTFEHMLQLNTYTPAAIQNIQSLQQSKRNQVLTTTALADTAQKRADEHAISKPEMDEQDNWDTLLTHIAECEQQQNELNEKKGAINRELTIDQQNKERLNILIQDAEQKKNIYYNWSRINQLIGDATGNKFRKIAQSYVLSSLIHSANNYMRTLTDRYLLKVTPGTFVISLEDAYQGYVSRAASTISGGESFLVSLSLALALSDIGQNLSADTLFIDEGFGTLSGEPLQNAINTLRSLRNKAGRHVGIISHVEELQERIPVQIRVIQDGNNSNSKIEIIPNK